MGAGPERRRTRGIRSPRPPPRQTRRTGPWDPAPGPRYHAHVILDWEEAFRAGPATVGGKGFNLARLHRYGFPVPRGGVLPAEVYSDFIRPFNVERVAD